MNTESNSGNNLENGTASEGQVESNGEAYKGDPELAAGNPSPGTPDEPTQAAQADTEASTALNPYTEWQAKYEHLLMDGTYSLASYIRLAENEEVEYGVQLRVFPGNGQVHIGYRARAAFKVLPLESADQPRDHAEKQDEHERLDKVDGLTSFFDGTPEWNNVSSRRVSRVNNFAINVKPLSDHPEGELAKFKAFAENHLMDVLLALIPTPAQGYTDEALEAFRTALIDYIAMTVDQFQMFRRVEVTIADWNKVETPSELPEELVASIESLKNPTQGGADNPEQAE